MWSLCSWVTSTASAPMSAAGSLPGPGSMTRNLPSSSNRTQAWVYLVIRTTRKFGVDLQRLPLVPDPGPLRPDVVAAQVDGVDVVLIGATPAANPVLTRRLSARVQA